jgi:hypothetical protein
MAQCGKALSGPMVSLCRAGLSCWTYDLGITLRPTFHVGPAV